MTATKTIHLKKPRKTTPQEDFSDAVIPQAYLEEQVLEKEHKKSTQRDLDDMSMLDLFAMVVAPGVAQKYPNDAPFVAKQSYEIGREMFLQHLHYKERA